MTSTIVDHTTVAQILGATCGTGRIFYRVDYCPYPLTTSQPTDFQELPADQYGCWTHANFDTHHHGSNRVVVPLGLGHWWSTGMQGWHHVVATTPEFPIYSETLYTTHYTSQFTPHAHALCHWNPAFQGHRLVGQSPAGRRLWRTNVRSFKFSSLRAFPPALSGPLSGPAELARSIGNIRVENQSPSHAWPCCTRVSTPRVAKGSSGWAAKKAVLCTSRACHHALPGDQ